MTKKERQQETNELHEAISALRAAIRGMAQRKAAHYEAEFLIQARDMLNKEIESNDFIRQHVAEYTAKEVQKQIEL